MTKQEATDKIKLKAKTLGFFLCGISQAEFMENEARRLESWLYAGAHGQMKYMENYFNLRTDPRKLVPGCKSVISLGYNYYTSKTPVDLNAPKISKYAYGRDYHKVVKSKLKSLFQFIRDEIGEVAGRLFVDSAPVLERDWAKRSGLGWIGKHTLLLNPKKGSYFFLAEAFLDLDLVYDQPMKDYCGTCTKCIDACPTDAISPSGYILDASKCISYLTIELKDNIPKEFKGKMENYMFGCDICQEVCPWNRFSQHHEENQFEPSAQLLKMTNGEWMELTKEIFDNLFIGSAVNRTKFEGLSRNIKFLQLHSNENAAENNEKE